MAEAFGRTGPTVVGAGTLGRWNSAFANWTKVTPALLYAVRLCASVCLALFVAFWLELDNAYWAGTSAAIVCLPQLGASMRKGWFRMIGTAIGAIVIVFLTACFPQDRLALLGLLAAWCGACAFAATLLRNFASYSAALAGYTAAIIVADNLGATGGASPDVFMLAITRASEICIGIACAGIVLAGTDLGSARRRLAESMAILAAEITVRFMRMLMLAGTQLPDMQAERRTLIQRVVALQPMIDQALGESSHVRNHTPRLQAAIYGLFTVLDGWRGVATHLRRLPEDSRRRGTDSILQNLPPELGSVSEAGLPALWMADPLAGRRVWEKAVRRLTALPADTPSMRLLADETAKVMAGIVQVLDELALLLDTPGQASPSAPRVRLIEPDWLPALINAVRAFLAIGALELLWVTTAWPNGVSAIVFVAIVVLLLSPRGDLAYSGSVAFALGTAGAVICGAIMKFAILPNMQTYPAFCAALALFYFPVGFAMALTRRPAVAAILTALAFNFNPLLAPTNQMSYDTAQFYNSALAIVVGCSVAPLAFWLLPPLSPLSRARRLLASMSRDLHLLAIDPVAPMSDEWQSRVFSQLTALPDQAEPLQAAQLLAALSVGTAIIGLYHLAARLGATEQLGAALTAFAQGNSASAIVKLHQFDDGLALMQNSGTEPVMALRARGRILLICEALDQHGRYFDAGAPA